ncbi:phosphoglucosamine mutase [Halapricum hydrolyticum]|uniref:Phosphoglucosamine mutase n=1 Tax=Halapricum hydrolyticum TaxID=2979991 RepID=A0AAE3IDX0_9EURY|nr:phosphoglucosamine mutase [Halapricum hydrolyticum]MCU4717531.1 phosphoglucosamine mutase [Halapricum hydrolyticum]MCU4726695.1 phosphoglucosamine mutase [Halapricum hydrolyticum]
MKVFGSSGVRGVVNETLTPEYALQVAMAAGTVWRNELGASRVAVAHDTRTSGGMISDAARSGLASVGLDVDYLGTIPTPGAQVYADEESIPALMVTASHNPPQHNGIKLIGPDGIELAVDQLERVEQRLLGERFGRSGWDAIGQTRTIDGVQRAYVDQLLESVDRERIADAELTVALDPGHGAGSVTSPQFFRELGCHVLTINAQPDGHFPGRKPEPVADNLGDLKRLVETTDADLGIAHDGDADRAIFVDETGAFIEGDAALAALAREELQVGDGVVSAVSTSQRLVDVVADVGAELHLTQIGSSHIITKVQELEKEGTRVPIAGEGNGGIIFPGYRTIRDGAYTAARFCELLADRRASKIAADYDEYYNVRKNISYEDEGERSAMTDAIEAVARETDAEVNTIDGYRIEFDDGWVLARPSGTEPLIRVYAEARDPDRAEALAALMYDAITAAPDET